MQRFSDFELWLLGATQNSKPAPLILAIECCSHPQDPRLWCRRRAALSISPYLMDMNIVDTSPWQGPHVCRVIRFPMRERSRLYLLLPRVSVPLREKLPFCRGR